MSWTHFKYTLIFAVVVAAIAAGGAAAALYHVSDRFQSTATLLLVPLPVPRNVDQPLQVPGGAEWKIEALRQQVAEALTLPTDLPKPPQPRYQLSVPDYAQLFRTHEMALRLQEFLQQKSKELSATLPALTLDQLRDRMQVRTRLLAQTREDVVYQECVELVFQYEFPDMTAHVANFWAEQCIGYAAALREERTRQVQKFFDDKLAALEPLHATGEAGAVQLAQREILATLRATAGLDTADFLLGGEAQRPSSPIAPPRREIILGAGLLAGFVFLALVLVWHTARTAFQA